MANPVITFVNKSVNVDGKQASSIYDGFSFGGIIAIGDTISDGGGVYSIITGIVRIGNVDGVDIYYKAASTPV